MNTMKIVAAIDNTIPPAFPSGVIDAPIIKNVVSSRAMPSHTHHGCPCDFTRDSLPCASQVRFKGVPL